MFDPNGVEDPHFMKIKEEEALQIAERVSSGKEQDSNNIKLGK